jgi:hypothetical protein
MATLVGLGVPSLAGCDEGKGSYGAPMGPPVHAIATSLDRYRQAGGEAQDVPLHPRFVVRFDRILSPSADYRPNFTLRSGAFANVTFREIRVDPVARQVVFVIADALLPQTRYVLHIESGPDAATRLAAVDGAPFDGPLDVPFTTERARTADEVDETDIDPDLSADDACKVTALFAQQCAGSSCHGTQPQPTDAGLVGSAPAMGLNLASSAGIQGTAVDQAAIGVAYEATPSGTGQPSSPVFPYGLPLIRSGQSSASYLLYKVLKRGPVGDSKGASAFALADVADPSAQAVSDLRALRGSGMPHDSLPSDPSTSKIRAPLDWSEVHRLRRWIDAGARPCAAP